MKNFWETMKPAVVMVAVQIVFSACNVIYKLAINDGMSTIVISAYRMAFAAATTIPIALIFERKRPKMSWRVIFMTFLSGTFGGTLFQNLFYGALVLASATLVSAIYNLIPSITFILAVFCGFEKLNWGRVSGKAKVVGTLLGLAGALLLTFYKGVEFDIWPFSINLLDPHKNHQTDANVAADTSRELLGVLCVVISCFSFSLWLIIQGILASGVMILVIAWVVQMKGPLFASAFNPLMLLIVAFVASMVLDEKLNLGSVLGGVLIICGLYTVLWGKGKEAQKKSDNIEPQEIMEDYEPTRPLLSP
ncbi:WAT1-related protein At1g25270-like isoform X2 [Lotus japonicus]|uniref:WAT1-related protein At1g25270-like isoform X2 n=1 Tax=Lotus japonicus TaxID=34305 RepID=UPI00258604BF|nr:WAT1-related protein At1g25270-like isoform X2 [Lotus japonicus]